MCIAVLLAAGSSKRFKADIPKQYCQISGKMLIEYPLETFLKNDAIKHIIITTHPDHKGYFKHLKNPRVTIIDGGITRQKSVYNALKEAHKYNPQKILIHDTARALVTNKLITELIESLDISRAVIPVIPESNTVKQIENGVIVRTIDRNNLYHAQTPQAFEFQTIYEAHKNLKDSDHYTDDSLICEENNIPVKTIKGEENNFKVTTIRDLEKIKNILGENQMVTINGFGYDIHAYGEEEGNHQIILGGVKIDHNKPVKAHSDGDLVIHAIVDAILGCTCDGDIGDLFPDDDPANKDANSKIFLDKALSLLAEKNMELIHLDICIVCQAPRLKEKKLLIKQSLAKMTSLPESSINVKATTNEKMDAIGNKKAIACYATVTVKK